jgi:hypothetical protein
MPFYTLLFFISNLSCQQRKPLLPQLWNGHPFNSSVRTRIGVGCSTLIRTVQASLDWYPTTFHINRAPAEAFILSWHEFSCCCRYQSVSCDASQHVTSLATSRSTLNLCPPRFYFSPRNRRYWLGGGFPQSVCVCFSDEILCHVNLFYDEIYYI